MKPLKWTIGDIIDLEYFLKKDLSQTHQTDLKKRDRAIYLDFIRPVLNKENHLNGIYHDLPENKGPEDNIQEDHRMEGRTEKNFSGNKTRKETLKKNMIRLWLDAIRAGEKAETSSSILFPGGFYEEIHRVLKFFFIISGILSGISLCASFFSYTGTKPLNIAYFFAITIVPQILLITILLLSFLLTKQRLIKRKLLSPYGLISFCVEKFMLLSEKKIFGKISGLKREKILSVLGIMREGHIVYGFLFFWPVFILMQIFAMGFNIGVLGSTLFHILFFDTAFGWQSTVQINPHIVHKIVSIIATPWSWLIPQGIAFPGLAEIQGSRMILKDGIFHLTTTNLVSWWPFLCLAVLFYGLLPRFILFVSATICLRRNINHQKLNHGDCSRLIRRMLTPLVSINPMYRDQKNPVRQSLSPDLTRSMDTCNFPEPVEEMSVEFTALVPDDIYDQCDFDQLKQIVKNKLGCYLKYKKRIGVDPDKDVENIIEIILKNGETHSHGFILLYEAWQPPIREILSFIKNIRKQGSGEMPFIIVLIGKPCKETIFTPVKKIDLKIWNMKITGIGDPYIQVEPLVEEL